MWRPLLAFALASLGFAAGASLGRYRFPAEHIDADPAALRIDYVTDYALMVAERFQSDHNREAALHRLAVLGDNPPDSILTEVIGFARSISYSKSDIEMLQQLQQALGVMTYPGATSETSP